MSEEIKEKVSVLVDKINRMTTKEQVAATAYIDGVSIGIAIAKEEAKENAGDERKANS